MASQIQELVLGDQGVRILTEITETRAKMGKEWFCASSFADASEHGYPLDYRYYICYALRSYMMQLRLAPHREEFTLMLNQMHTSLQNNRSFEMDSFFHIYPLPENRGFVVADDVNACFPLMIKKGKGRFSAFMVALRDVMATLDEILPILATPQNLFPWNTQMQHQLESHFNRPTVVKKQVA